MNIKEQKKLLRTTMFKKRSSLAPNYKSAYDYSICQKVIKLIDELNCHVVHCYIPMANEIDIKPVILYLLENQKTVVCPKTLPNRRLENRILNSLNSEDLEYGPMKTQHPIEPNRFAGKYDLIIVPGLAFDQFNYRLGYGGGYYDTFLTENKDAHTVGVFYPFQETLAVPKESHDISLQRVLVNKELKD